MKTDTLTTIIEEIARKHLGIYELRMGTEPSTIPSLSTLSIKSALIDAIKAGEQIGYETGISDLESRCTCTDTLIDKF